MVETWWMEDVDRFIFILQTVGKNLGFALPNTKYKVKIVLTITYPLLKDNLENVSRSDLSANPGHDY